MSIIKAYNNKDFLLSPEAEPVRQVAESLYITYLKNALKRGRKMKPVSPAIFDDDFINSTDARWFRILAEAIFAEVRLKKEKIHHTIVFFGSARLLEKAHAESMLKS